MVIAMAFVISGDGGQWRFNCSSVDTPEAFDKLRALPRHYYSWLGQSIRRRGIFIAPHVRQAVEWPRLHSLEVADENRRKWPGKEDGNLSGEVSGLEFTLNRPILSFVRRQCKTEVVEICIPVIESFSQKTAISKWKQWEDWERYGETKKFIHEYKAESVYA